MWKVLTLKVYWLYLILCCFILTRTIQKVTCFWTVHKYNVKEACNIYIDTYVYIYIHTNQLTNPILSNSRYVLTKVTYTVLFIWWNYHWSATRLNITNINIHFYCSMQYWKHYICNWILLHLFQFAFPFLIKTQPSVGKNEIHIYYSNFQPIFIL